MYLKIKTINENIIKRKKKEETGFIIKKYITRKRTNPFFIGYSKGSQRTIV